jgi:hypothetical protein
MITWPVYRGEIWVARTVYSLCGCTRTASRKMARGADGAGTSWTWRTLAGSVAPVQQPNTLRYSSSWKASQDLRYARRPRHPDDIRVASSKTDVEISSDLTTWTLCNLIASVALFTSKRGYSRVFNPVRYSIPRQGQQHPRADHPRQRELE